MKAARFYLVIVVLFAVVGGASAFKANRMVKFFYRYTISFVNGQLTGVCDDRQPTTFMYATVPRFNGILITYSAAPAQSVFSCTAFVVQNL